MANNIKLDAPDYQFKMTVKAKGSPKKGVNAQTVVVTVKGIKGEWDSSILLNSLKGRGFAVAAQSNARSSVQAELDMLLADDNKDTLVCYQLATDAIPKTQDMDFPSYLLGNGQIVVDPQEQMRVQYRIWYQSAIDDGMSEEKAVASADAKIIAAMKS